MALFENMLNLASFCLKNENLRMLRKVSPYKIEENFIDLIGKQWMLVTAGNANSFNSLTASWGGVGKLWNWSVAFIFIRPQRYTYGFSETNSHFTLCFFDKKYKTELTYFGTHSGRNTDKVADTGLTPQETQLGNIYYEESKLVIECEKIYFHDLDPENFSDNLINRNYPNKDYHRMYVGKIVNCFVEDNN